MPKFSIIIPVYNVAPYLRECLDSVLAQTFTDWEAICVDDGSTDGSGAILDEYAAKDVRFRVIHQENAGVSAARNAALDVARGEWIVFLDADDLVSVELLSDLVAAALQYPDEKLFRFQYRSFIDTVPPSAGDKTFGWRRCDIAHSIRYDEYCVYTWQYAFRHDLIRGVNFPRYIRGEDRVYLLRILCQRAHSYVDTRKAYYFYRKRLGSAVNSRPSVQVLKDELTHRVDVIEAIDASGKIMPYAETDWLERYCVQTYLGLSLRSAYYSRADQEDLLSWFYQQLPRLRKSHGFSRLGMFVVKCYSLWPYATMRRGVCAFLPFVYRMCSALKEPDEIAGKIGRRLRVFKKLVFSRFIRDSTMAACRTQGRAKKAGDVDGSEKC